MVAVLTDQYRLCLLSTCMPSSVLILQSILAKSLPPPRRSIGTSKFLFPLVPMTPGGVYWHVVLRRYFVLLSVRNGHHKKSTAIVKIAHMASSNALLHHRTEYSPVHPEQCFIRHNASFHPGRYFHDRHCKKLCC